MKTIKKLFAMLLAVIMTFGMMSTVFADPGDPTNPEKGSITITNAVPGQTYSIYRIFDLESYDEKNGIYLYKVNAAWKNFIEQDTINGVYVSIDGNGYVSWKKDAPDIKEFVKLALKANIGSTDSQKATETTVSFDDLDLGYYLVDSTVGTLCVLNTTDPNMNITDKNHQPTVEKEVQENSDNSWGEENSAQIGDTVNFKVIIDAKEGAQGYILHEKMQDGLTYTNDSVKVYKVNTDNKDNVEFDDDDRITEGYTVKDENMEVHEGKEEKCTFEAMSLT